MSNAADCERFRCLHEHVVDACIAEQHRGHTDIDRFKGLCTRHASAQSGTVSTDFDLYLITPVRNALVAQERLGLLEVHDSGGSCPKAAASSGRVGGRVPRFTVWIRRVTIVAARVIGHDVLRVVVEQGADVDAATVRLPVKSSRVCQATAKRENELCGRQADKDSRAVLP